MIRVCNLSDYEDIIRIWSDAFGDSRAYILDFLNKFSQYVYISENNAIMTLFPVTLNNKKGKYIYAVAVDKTKRNCGIGKKLIDFAKKNSEDFCVLVPANIGLFEYYRKLGFSDNSYIGKYEEIKKEERISAKEYFELRDKYFNGKDYIKWSEEQLFKIASLYDANFYKNKESTEISMLSNNRIIEYLGKSEPTQKRLFSMIYPDKFKNSYFNIAID